MIPEATFLASEHRWTVFFPVRPFIVATSHGNLKTTSELRSTLLPWPLPSPISPLQSRLHHHLR
uniref:Uncharacterized protein n=1 Tax=Arundo donax TaxID=35708 RepID=A0A0A9ALP4_ARUDO